MMENDEICCWSGTFETLASLTRDAFMDPVKEVFQRWTGRRAPLAQIRSWHDEFRVLKYRVFNRFKRWEKFVWEDVEVFFELVLPKRKKERFPKRMDVTLVTEALIIIVEFKRHEEMYDGFLKQVVGYCQRVRKMEVFTKGRPVHGILCYSQIEEDVFELQEGVLDNGWSESVLVCSQDKLKDALLYLQART